MLLVIGPLMLVGWQYLMSAEMENPSDTLAPAENASSPSPLTMNPLSNLSSNASVTLPRQSDESKTRTVDCQCRETRHTRCLLVVSKMNVSVAMGAQSTRVVIHLPEDIPEHEKTDLIETVFRCPIVYHDGSRIDVHAAMEPPDTNAPRAGCKAANTMSFVYPQPASQDLASHVLESFQYWLVQRDAVYRLTEWLGLSEAVFRKMVTETHVVLFNDTSAKWSGDKLTTTIDNDRYADLLRAVLPDRSDVVVHPPAYGTQVICSDFTAIGSYGDTSMLERDSFETPVTREVQMWVNVMNQWADRAFDIFGKRRAPGDPNVGRVLASGSENASLVAKVLLPEVAAEYDSATTVAVTGNESLAELIVVVRNAALVVSDGSVGWLPLLIFMRPMASWVVVRDEVDEHRLSVYRYLAAHALRGKLLEVSVEGAGWEQRVLSRYLSVELDLLSPWRQVDASVSERLVPVDLALREAKRNSSDFFVSCVCPPDPWGMPQGVNPSISCSLVIRNARISVLALPVGAFPEMIRVRMEVFPDVPSTLVSAHEEVFATCPLFIGEASVEYVLRLPDRSIWRANGKTVTNETATTPLCRLPSSELYNIRMTAIFAPSWPNNMYHSLLYHGYFAMVTALSAAKKLLMRDHSAAPKISRTGVWVLDNFAGFPLPPGAFVNTVDDILIAEGTPSRRFNATATGENYTSCSEYHVVGCWSEGTMHGARRLPWMVWEFNRRAAFVREVMLSWYGPAPNGTQISPFLIMPRSGFHRRWSTALGKQLAEVFQAEIGVAPDWSDRGNNDPPNEQFWHFHNRKLVITPEGAAVTYAFLSRPGATWIVTWHYEVNVTFYDNTDFHGNHLRNSTHIRTIFVMTRYFFTFPMSAVIAEYRKPFVPGVVYIGPRPDAVVR